MRLLIGALVAIGAFILIIVIIIKLVFSGGGTPKNALDLNSFSNTDYQVELTINGPITAAKDHNQVKIEVGRDQADINVMQGYDGHVINAKSFNNSQKSYDAFLRALTIAGFNKGDDNPKNRDALGQCAMGNSYVFSVYDPDGQQVQHYWTTSCGGGTYGGDWQRTLNLFRAQIPDYDTVVSAANVY